MLGRLFDAPRTIKRIISVSYDFLAIAFSLYAAICMRLGRFDPPLGKLELASFGITLAISIIAFTKLGLYRAILRFMAHQAVVSVAVGICISAATLAISSFFLQSFIPRSVPIIYALTALFFVGMPRLLVRSVVLLLTRKSNVDKEAVVIYGAGHGGYQLASALLGSKYRVVAFVDDNPKLAGTIIRGFQVHRSAELPTLITKHNVKQIMLALGNAPRSQRSQIIEKLEPLGISVKTMPAPSDILSGKSKIEDIQDVQVEDLLGRDPIKPNPALLGACIKGKNVLVTGAGGSIGSELCRQIIKQAPNKLILLELNEYNLYRIEKELKNLLVSLPYKIDLISLIGTVQNKSLLKDVFSTFQVDTIYHAAAYKHVPLIEHNIVEGVNNNVFGTLHCAQSAIESGVESFVLISTDKAVRPTNVMGASKRIAELILQALARENNVTRFTMVRFGNVLGSSGSVVPLFREQIKKGGPVTVTHPDIIRYFMTIPEAAELVIQAGSMGKGGDVFVLDMGEPVKIVELARSLIHLSGLTIKEEGNEKGEIAINFTGLRPGEKLFEELLIGENVTGTIHQRILRAEEKFLPWNSIKNFLNNLNYACEQFDCKEIKEILLSAPTDYQSKGEINDWMWNHKNQSAKLKIVN